MDSRKISELLKTHRTEQGLTLQSVADRTKIKMSYLQAMESGDFSVFEMPIYVRNFVRTYARFLKIPESTVLPLLDDPKPAAVSEDGPAKSAAVEMPVDEPGPGLFSKRMFSFFLLVGAVAVALAGFGYLFRSQSAKTESGDDPSKKIMSGPYAAPDTASVTAADTVSATEVQSSERAAHAVQLHALDDVWVFWESDGKSEIKKILAAGEVQKVPFSSELRLRIGNTSGVNLTLDGRDIPFGSEKIYDKIFKVADRGRISIESPGARELRRFRPKPSEEENF